MSLAALTSLWFWLVCTQRRAAPLVLFPAGVAGGLGICILVEFLVPLAACALAIIMWLFALVCPFLLLQEGVDTRCVPCVESRESDRRSKIHWSSTMMLTLNYLGFGYVVGLGSLQWQRIVCLCVASVVTVILFYDAQHRRRLTERSVAPYTPALMFCAFACTAMFGPTACGVAMCVLAGVVSLYVVFGLCAMSEHIRLSTLSPLRVFGRARACGYLGMLLGMACGLAVVTLDAREGGSILAFQVSVCVAVGYSIVSALCHKVRFPEEGFSAGGTSLGEEGDTYQLRCHAVATRFGLSERQYEVMALVGRGRSAKYVSEALTISLSTAQTHIRNIYAKLGVHSRQELQDLIDQTKLYGED